MVTRILGMLLMSFLFGACNDTNNTKNQPASEKVDSSRLHSARMIGVRNKRYCEILLVSGKLWNMVATVYNTLGCSECPDSAWKKIDQEKLKEYLNAKSIKMNGPRVFLMDSVGQFNSPPTSVNLGGVEMIERAKLEVSLKMLMNGKIKPYEEKLVNRTTKYIFNKGSYAYFLHHNQESYIMQSYAQIVNPDLNEAALKKLSNVLKLPSDWVYETKLLQENIILENQVVGETFVIQDELENTYQKIKH